jgi:hypothetical protein
MGLLTSTLKTVADWVKAGYPEEVAKRIVSGELPMDEASRLARAQEQGYGDVLYRGHSDTNPVSGNADVWATASKNQAQTYARGGEVYDEALDDYVTAPGTVTPIRSNANDLHVVPDTGNRVTDYHWGVQSDINGIPEVGTDAIAEAVKNEGKQQGSLFENIYDDFDGKGTKGQDDVYNILGSRPDVNIRHVDAAYDPQYTGPNIMGGAALPVAAGLLAAGQSEDADAGPLKLAAGLTPDLAARQLKNRLNKERQKGISPGNTATDFVHRNTNYDNGFLSSIKKSGEGYGGPSYISGVKEFAQELWQGTDDPMVRSAISDWATPRLQRGGAAAGAGLLSAGAMASPTTPQERGFPTWEEVSRDPTAPLPAPTWGEAMGKAGDNIMTVLDAPLSGIQGLSRVGYGLLNGENFDTAMNHGADVVNGGVEAGADRFGNWVSDVTGDDTLGFYAKWGSLLGSPF